MRRVLIFLLAIVIFIPLSAVSVSAASYDLGDPTFPPFALTSWWRDYQYVEEEYDEDGNLVSESYVNMGNFSGSFFGYYEKPLDFFNGSPIFSRGSSFSPSKFLSTETYDYQRCVILLLSGDSRDLLHVEHVVYENILLPGDGQVLKVEFEVDPFFKDPVIADVFYYYAYYIKFGFIYANNDISTAVFPSVVSVTNFSNCKKFVYYFNINGESLDTLKSLGDIRLGISIPFYFPNEDDFSNSFGVLNYANFPTTYEIITVGGYEQELKSIENAIYTSNQQLIDLYTTQSEQDVTYVLKLDNSNSELENSIFDYQSAAAPVQQIRDQFTTPPLGDSVNQVFDDFSPSGVKSVFSLGWVISAVGLVFSFCVIRLILYGTKEG